MVQVHGENINIVLIFRLLRRRLDNANFLERDCT